MVHWQSHNATGEATIVSFVYRSVHTLSENKLATAQTDEKCPEMR